MKDGYERDSTSASMLLSLAVSIFLLCFFSTPLVSSAHAEQQKDAKGTPVYVLGVYPALSISLLDKLFSPIAREIGDGLNRPILFQSSSSYEKYSARLSKGDFDIALVHPFDYVLHAEKAGYLPVVRKNEDLTAIFVVPEDSPIKTFSDLKGKTIAMAPAGSAVDYLAKAELIRAGLLPKDVLLKHFGEHDSTLQNVVIKNTDAATTCRAILRVFENSLGTKLRIIKETSSIPHSIFVVHKRVPEKERKIIRNILLNTTLSGVPEDLRKVFVIEGKKPFIDISTAEIKILKTNPAIKARKK
jgi:ABC-type phosphate/phosphonate transport system substrate-binding protein